MDTIGSGDGESVASNLSVRILAHKTSIYVRVREQEYIPDSASTNGHQKSALGGILGEERQYSLAIQKARRPINAQIWDTATVQLELQGVKGGAPASEDQAARCLDSLRSQMHSHKVEREHD